MNVDYKVKHKEQLLKMYILTSAESEKLLWRLEFFLRVRARVNVKYSIDIFII